MHILRVKAAAIETITGSIHVRGVMGKYKNRQPPERHVRLHTGKDENAVPEYQLRHLPPSRGQANQADRLSRSGFSDSG